MDELEEMKEMSPPPLATLSSSPGKADRQKFNKERGHSAPYKKGTRGRNMGGPPFNRVLVTNIPYEEKWQILKDKFREKVGEVTYVELFTDEQGKSRGYGIVEFRNRDLCKKAVEVMNKTEIMGRKILVREDYNGDFVERMLRRDNHHSLGGHQGHQGGSLAGLPPPMPGRQMPPPPHDLLSALAMPKLGGGGHGHGNPFMDGPSNMPMGNTVFVANLDYKVTYSKLKEVFSLAGRIQKLDLLLDKNNKSRGMATVTYEDPHDAAQAISMLNNQRLYDRSMLVKMDKDQDKRSRLPEGLSGIGPGIGSGRSLDVGMRNPDMGNPLAMLGGSLGGAGPDLSKALRNPLTAGLSALSRSALSDHLQGNPLVGRNALNLAGLAGLGVGDLQRLALGAGRGDLLGNGRAAAELLGNGRGAADLLANGRGAELLGNGRGELTIEQRLYEEQRARLLAAAQPSAMSSERERIEMDIARVDNRIRDLDRSLMVGERSVRLGNGNNLPPMPPPMGSRGGRVVGGGGGVDGQGMFGQVRGCTVFIRNLPFSVTWQKLRDRFSRCGKVMFAEIKMENGKSRGFGHVRFDDPDNAEAAVRYFQGLEWDGRRLEASIDERDRR